MKKKFAGMVVVMALWAMGAYALGRHHGATKGPMEMPAVHIQWKAEDAPKGAEAKSEEIDYVAISAQSCGLPESKETVKK